MRPLIVSSLDLSGAPDAVAALCAVGELRQVRGRRAEVLDAIGKAEAYLAGAEVRIDSGFLDRAPTLRVIGSPSTGTDHMDKDEIDRRGIVRFDIAREFELIGGFTATSELAFGLLLTLVRNIRAASAAAEAGDWARERFSGYQLYAKTFGVLGLGRLGTISARIANGFGMRVIGHDIRDDATAPDVAMVSFATLLAESDVLSVHVHLTPKTEALIGAAELAAMKPGAILLNTARGRIIDEGALLAALRAGHLGGVGLDVIDGEWLDDKAAHPLIVEARTNPRLLITPHIGGATAESIYGARIFMARKLANWLAAS